MKEMSSNPIPVILIMEDMQVNIEFLDFLILIFLTIRINQTMTIIKF